MEDLLLYFFIEVVGYGPHEHTLREVADLRGRDQRIHLRIGRKGRASLSERYGFALLENLAEAFGKRLGRVAYDLSGKDVAYGVLDHLALLVPVIPRQLAEVLKAEADGHLVRAGRGDQIVQPAEIDRGELVDDDCRFELALLVYQAHDAGVVKPEGCRVDVLPVGVVPHAEDLGRIGVVDVEGEVVPGHHPVELRGDHARKGNLGRGDLSLQLVLRPAFPCVHKGTEVVFELRVGGQDDEDVGISFI